MPEDRIAWAQATGADAPLRRFVGRVGSVEIGTVEYDGSNRMFVWSSPLAEDAWGWGPTEHAAKQALELWLKRWLENFRGLLA